MPPTVHLYGPPLAPPVELSRWMLERLEIPYSFTVEAAGLSAFHSWRCKVPVELPLMMVDGVHSGGVRQAFGLIGGPIAEAHGKAPPAVDGAFAEMQFAKLFSPAVRTFYFHMLPRPDLLKSLAITSVPASHRFIIRNAYPLWRALMERGLTLASYDAATVVAGIEACFAAVADRAAGKAFIGGDAPSDEDIVFAALASPVILPPEHPVSLPPVEALPAELASLIVRMRATPAGLLALRTYAAARGEGAMTTIVCPC